MSAKYDVGRREALEALGLRPKANDNPVVRKFISRLDDSARTATGAEGGNRPLHRQAWGKKVEYSTSNQDVSGGGTRL